MKKTTKNLGISLLLLICCGAVSAAPIDMYGTVLSTLSSYELDPVNSSVIGEHGDGVEIAGLAFGPDGGLFGLDQYGLLYEVDMITGAATFVGDTNIGWTGSLDTMGNGLVGVSYASNSVVYFIDPLTAAATVITNVNQRIGIVVAAALHTDGRLFVNTNHRAGQVSVPGYTIIHAIDLNTGDASEVGMIADQNVNGMDFDSRGMLIAQTGSTQSILEIDPVTMQITNLGRGADGSNAFAISTVVPIPAAVWLFGSGLGLLGWMRRKPA